MNSLMSSSYGTGIRFDASFPLKKWYVINANMAGIRKNNREEMKFCILFEILFFSFEQSFKLAIYVLVSSWSSPSFRRLKSTHFMWIISASSYWPWQHRMRARPSSESSVLLSTKKLQYNAIRYNKIIQL